jgi:hypothetical protein
LVKEAIKDFFWAELKKIVKRWSWCFEVERDYVEEQC